MQGWFIRSLSHPLVLWVSSYKSAYLNEIDFVYVDDDDRISEPSLSAWVSSYNSSKGSLWHYRRVSLGPFSIIIGGFFFFYFSFRGRPYDLMLVSSTLRSPLFLFFWKFILAYGVLGFVTIALLPPQYWNSMCPVVWFYVIFPPQDGVASHLSNYDGYFCWAQGRLMFIFSKMHDN